jgi:hypothetical protein
MPAAILIFLFFVVPAIWGIYVSFTNMALVGKAARHLQFVGFQKSHQNPFLYYQKDRCRRLHKLMSREVGSSQNQFPALQQRKRI